MALEVTIYRYKTNENYANPNDPNSFTPATPAVYIKNTTTVVSTTNETSSYVPRAAFAELAEGDNNILYKKEFPADRTIILWVYTYDSNGYQVGNRVTNESVTGFTINVPKACTLKYIATIEN